ncbi:MAG: GTP cyclohydrolase, partial [Flavobacteriaceae bacterium]|nr:GTP cyclohydrolase [Flavobacteriaceae bacterium]
MIFIKIATKLEDYKAFVNFPFKLYKNSKYWVPPISNEELEMMDK